MKGSHTGVHVCVCVFLCALCVCTHVCACTCVSSMHTCLCTCVYLHVCAFIRVN